MRLLISISWAAQTTRPDVGYFMDQTMQKYFHREGSAASAWMKKKNLAIRLNLVAAVFCGLLLDIYD